MRLQTLLANKTSCSTRPMATGVDVLLRPRFV